MRHLGLAVTAAALGLWIAGGAAAAPVSPVSLEIAIDGVGAGVFDETQIGCVAGGGDTFQCSGSGQFGGETGMNLTWDMTFDSDPVITGITAVTNLSASAQQFTLIFTLPTSVAPSSLMGGSLQGGTTDNTGDGATITAPTGSAFYTALIDGVTQQMLYADPSSFGVGSFLSGSFVPAAWGTPIPSAPGPAVTTNIQIRLDFILTGNDSASMTSNFVVIPVPEPDTGLLLTVGLGIFVALRRRAR